MTILGSILIYPAGGMRYIDALFFSSGSATQSGLNTIDLNKITLYQQVVIMLIACVCNPIFINTFVVFVRLYWFEKRFQGVVQEAARNRSRTFSKRKSEMREDRDIAHEELGVGGRPITVVRDSEGYAQGANCNMEGEIEEDGKENEAEEQSIIRPSSNSKSSGGLSEEPAVPAPLAREPSAEIDAIQPFRRDITFADDVKPPPRRVTTTDIERLPERRTAEQHIAFVENQRRPKAKGRLRIPGPRDYDRGDKPQRLDEDDNSASLGRQRTNDSSQRGRDEEANQPADAVDPGMNGDDQQLKKHRTFSVSEPWQPGKIRTGLDAFKRKITLKDEEDPPSGLRQRNRTATFKSFLTSKSQDRDPMPYLSWTPTIGRNSAFVDLTEDQREELGGIEYRALKTLAFILVCYYVGFHLLGMVCLLPWSLHTHYKNSVLKPDKVSAAWWGVFTPASMFNDLGFTLTPDSMTSYHDAIFPLLLGSFLIVIGNTGFPCMLRFIIWVAAKCVPYESGVFQELKFLLDHPRRCFTLLFPSKATWWLFWVLVILNGTDLILFVVLDLNDSTVTSLPPGIRVLNGLFVAFSTRTAGFTCINISDLHPAVQVSYLIMMYISVFPIAISLRRTNVYEEKSLGLYADAEEEDEGVEQSYVSTHLRRQLSFDLWFVFLGFFLIAIIEGSRLQNTNEYSFELFSVLFEIVSAYGTVGLSLGYPTINASFSAEFATLSKLIIIAMQIRGRHRGLPYALDRAILLPSDTLHKKEDEELSRRVTRRGSVMSKPEGGFGGGENAPFNRQPTFNRRASVMTAFDEEGAAAGVGAGAGLTTVPTRSGRGPTTMGLTKLLSGALSAGPSIQREKKA
ncbi:uncharacterized protein K452DRAFT_310039 [Aplosporella prunicola CBS 121167]|uniref:Potassium transport protein n=1 Tax=Aplosporella prunicola CBS 121167 TaxID=1176127 RepID=A0A6A6BCR9_9PEZI|nr:uncharacterized protein K452DRAFT_310039 [Aplosporella prunicola CBS 121167]KAF2140281.1 hypothetical protein K452DRAFT_310039 [Aplosporella prunicola CBS 121167]